MVAAGGVVVTAGDAVVAAGSVVASDLKDEESALY